MNPMLAIALLATTIRDVGEGPESSFFLPLMQFMNADTFQKYLGLLVKIDVCTVSGNYVRYVKPVPGSKADQFMSGLAKIEEEARAKAG